MLPVYQGVPRPGKWGYMDNIIYGLLDALHNVGLVVVRNGERYFSLYELYDRVIVSNILKVFNGVLSFLNLPTIDHPDLWSFLFGFGMLVFVLSLVVRKIIKFFV